MLKSFKRIILLFVCLFIVGAHCQDVQIIDGGSLTSKNGSEYYWDMYLLPLRVHIDSSLSPEIKGIIKAAAQRWEDEIGFDVFEIYEVSPTSKEILGFPVGGVISVSRTQLGMADWSDSAINGMAEISLFKDDLGGIEGRIYGVNMWLDIDLLVHRIYDTAVHEFGHCLSLAHDTNDPSSIMFPSSERNIDADIKKEDILRIRLKAFR